MSGHATHDYTDSSAPPRLCRNCSTPLRGPYCSACGQHDVDYHQSFHHLAHDLLENLFHFEGKSFHTVAILLARPGRLTCDFIAGRRQSQLNPLRFYIFISVLFFLGVSLLNHGHLIDFDRRRVDDLQAKLAASLARENARTDAPPLSGEQVNAVAERVGSSIAEGRVDSSNLQTTIQEAVASARSETASTPAAPGESSPAKETPAGNNIAVHVDPQSPLGHALVAKLKSGELTLGNIWDAIERRIPTLLFLGVPLFALLLKLTHLRARRYYLEHLIFALHLHTWAFLALMVGSGYLELASLGPAWLSTFMRWCLVVWAVWYVFASFRAVYQQTWTRIGLKLVLLFLVHAFLLSCVSLLFFLGTIYWLAMS